MWFDGGRSNRQLLSSQLSAAGLSGLAAFLFVLILPSLADMPFVSAMKFYHKVDPRNRIYTGAGWAIPFKEMGGQDGWLATGDSYIIAELQKCINEGRGGVMEITAAEYEQLKKKENQRSYPVWRETVGHKHLQKMFRDLHAAVVEAKQRQALPPVVRHFNIRDNIAKPAGISAFRPKAVSR